MSSYEVTRGETPRNEERKRERWATVGPRERGQGQGPIGDCQQEGPFGDGRKCRDGWSEMMAAGSERADATVESVEADTAAAGTDAVTDSLERDVLFHLLQSERRRRALRYLVAADEESVDMRDLAESVAAAEYDTTVEALDCDNRQRVYITLYQSHLPQLEAADVIEYDKDRGTISVTPLLEEFDEHVSADSGGGEVDEDRPSVPALVGFGAGGLLTLGLLPIVGVVGALGLAALVCTAAAAIGLQRRVGRPRGAADRPGQDVADGT